METQSLLARIEAYCDANKVSLTTFGRKVVNDGKFVGRLQQGGTITLQTFARVNDFLAQTEPKRRKARVAA